MMFVKPFEVSVILALLQVASCNSSEVNEVTIHILEMRKKLRLNFFFLHLDYISTFHTLNLKNLIRFVKPLKFSTI